jgi:hypothetical protein
MIQQIAYSPDIRAWTCSSRRPGAPLLKGNADFGWAVARWSCGRDQVREDKEAMMATGTVKWFIGECVAILIAQGDGEGPMSPHGVAHDALARDIGRQFRLY